MYYFVVYEPLFVRCKCLNVKAGFGSIPLNDISCL